MASAVEFEARATACVFIPAELRWQPTTSVPVRLVKESPTLPVSICIDDSRVSLADLEEVSLTSPQFVVLRGKDLGGKDLHVGLRFEDELSARSLSDRLSKKQANYERLGQYEPGSVQTYFQYYAKLGSQQNMLQDEIRTATYRTAILENSVDFAGKVAMDIGAGSGILSFFAAQAGADTVYAVEASSMAEVVDALAKSNESVLKSKIKVVGKPLEQIRDIGKVDVLVSEPIGTLLFNERMIETYLCARDRFLKPGGKMFPSSGTIFIAPFSDEVLHWEQRYRSSFWDNSSFHGIDLRPVMRLSMEEQFRKPVCDYINPNFLVATAQSQLFDFTTITIESLETIEMPFTFQITRACVVHGLAGWFDCTFDGSTRPVILSTAPWCPGTHWYQMRFLLENPLTVIAGQRIEGHFSLKSNNIQSYFARLRMRLQGTEAWSESLCMDLKDPEYRALTSANAYVPPPAGQPPPEQQDAPKEEGGMLNFFASRLLSSGTADSWNPWNALWGDRKKTGSAFTV